MSTLRFTVYGNAEPAGSKTAGRSKKGGLFVRDSNPNAAEWKRQIAQAAGQAVHDDELLEGGLNLTLHFYRPRPKSHYNTKGELNALGRRMKAPITKPDTLKLARAVEDAMTGIVYRDDAQIVVETLVKSYGEPARVVVSIGRLG